MITIIVCAVLIVLQLGAGINLVGHGLSDQVPAQIDPQHGAIRMSIRPQEFANQGGSYSIAMVSGVMAAGLAAASPIAAWRWASPTMLCLIRKITMWAAADATAFAPGSAFFDLIRELGFTVQDTGGGIENLTTSKAQAKSSRFPSSQLSTATGGSIQVSATATLTPGTQSPDTNAMKRVVGNVGAVPAGELIMGEAVLFDGTYPGAQPLELAVNEGFAVLATVPGTGTWKFGINVDWDEVDFTTWLRG